MREAIVKDPAVLRALLYAFPFGDDAVLVKAGPTGMSVLGHHPSQAMFGELSLGPGALAQMPDAPVSIGINRKYFAGSLGLAINQAFAKMDVAAALSFEASLDVKLMAGRSTESIQKLQPTTPGLTQLPRMADLSGHPSATGLRATILSEAQAAMEDLPDTDTVSVAFTERGLEFRPDSRIVPATFREILPTGGPRGASRLLLAIYKEVASFGGPGRGTGVQTVNVALIPNGIVRFEYVLQHGRMTYWSMPVME